MEVRVSWYKDPAKRCLHCEEWIYPCDRCLTRHRPPKCPYCAETGHELSDCRTLANDLISPNPKFNSLRAVARMLQEAGFQQVVQIPDPDKEGAG